MFKYIQGRVVGVMYLGGGGGGALLLDFKVAHEIHGSVEIFQSK